MGDLAYKQENDGTSHVYRLVLNPDNTARVEIDEEKIYEGSLKDDWEMLAAKEISDPADKKPDDWVTEKRIVDSAAKKPDDWDDEEDGEWEAPMIDNPEYVDDDNLYKYDDFGFIGFDLWQVKGNTIFDNVIITDDVTEADAFVKKWKTLSEVEKAKKKEEDDKKAEEAKAASDNKKDDADDDDDDKDDE